MLGCGTALDELSVVDISEGINEGCVVLDMITGSPELVVLLEGRAVLFTKVVEYGTVGSLLGGTDDGTDDNEGNNDGANEGTDDDTDDGVEVGIVKVVGDELGLLEESKEPQNGA